MILAITQVRPPRGNVDRAPISSLESQPGRTVVILPSAANESKNLAHAAENVVRPR